MRTTLELPDELIEDAMRLSGATTKRDAVCAALEEYVRRMSVEALLASAGTMDIAYVRPAMEEAELAAARDSASFTEFPSLVYNMEASQEPVNKIAEQKGHYSP